MDTSVHNLSALFEQLGLSNDDAAIARFIGDNGPLASTTSLADADFWTPAQAAFIKEAIAEDSDWAEVVDQLDASLRG